MCSPGLGSFFMMKTKFSESDIQFLSQFPEVFKIVTPAKVIFTFEFRNRIWENHEHPFSGKHVREELRSVDSRLPALFKTEAQKRIFYDTAKVLNRNGRPRGAANQTYGVLDHLSVQNAQKLLDSKWFEKGRNGKGVVFSDQLLKVMALETEAKSTEEALQDLGINPDWLGYQKLQILKRILSGQQKEPKAASYSESQIRSLKANPYVHSVTSKQLRMRKEFYQSGGYLFQQGLSVGLILKLFDLQIDDLSSGTLQMYQHRFRHEKNPALNLIRGSAEFFVPFLERLTELLKSEVSHFQDSVAALWKSSRNDTAVRREICVYVQESVSTVPGENLSSLLKRLKINRSTYYSIVGNDQYGKGLKKRKIKYEEDLQAVRQILEEDPFKKGSRQVQMQLKDRYGISLTRKRIQQLMRENGLKCTLRQSRPTRTEGRKALALRKKPNLLRRQFRLFRPMEVLETDVSYLHYGEGRLAYLSAVKDPSSGMIVSARISETNDLELAESNFEDLDGYKNRGVLFHSDQGALYLLETFQDHLRDMGFVQSMSGRGVCWDNAPMESFFGTFKSETDYKLLSSVEELQELMDNYRTYYNFRRPQKGRLEMTPARFREHLLSMSESEFEEYRQKEEARYQKMMEEARKKAIQANREGKMAVYEETEEWKKIKERKTETGINPENGG